MVITEHGFDKCSRLLLLLLAKSTAHLPGTEVSTVQSYRQKGGKRKGVKDKKSNIKEKAGHQEEERKHGNQQEGGRKKKTEAQPKQGPDPNVRWLHMANVA